MNRGPAAACCRQGAEDREARLQTWLQELRAERQRLEDRLLRGCGGACAAQDTRAALETDVQRLQQAKAELTLELQQAVQEGWGRAALQARSCRASFLVAFQDAHGWATSCCCALGAKSVRISSTPVLMDAAEFIGLSLRSAAPA